MPFTRFLAMRNAHGDTTYRLAAGAAVSVALLFLLTGFLYYADKVDERPWRDTHLMADGIRRCPSIAVFVRKRAADGIDAADILAVEAMIKSIQAREDEALIAGREPQVRCAVSTSTTAAR